MTAIEWFTQQLGIVSGSMLEQAKEMHKEDIVQAYSNGWHDGQDIIINSIKHIDKGGDQAGEVFYNETYKNKNNGL